MESLIRHGKVMTLGSMLMMLSPGYAAITPGTVSISTDNNGNRTLTADYNAAYNSREAGDSIRIMHSRSGAEPSVATLSAYDKDTNASFYCYATPGASSYALLRDLATGGASGRTISASVAPNSSVCNISTTLDSRKLHP
jgi:hypothetical protein